MRYRHVRVPGCAVLLLTSLFSTAPLRAQVYTGLQELGSPNEQGGGHFGQAVSGVGDLNGDEWPDLLVGAPGEVAGADNAGRAYVFSGVCSGCGTPGTLLHTLTSPNGQADGAFGAAVAGVGDLDGDGSADLLVGAPGEGAGAGRAYVFSGASGTLRYALISPDAQADGAFGAALSGVADVNGDGVPDLIVGAPAEAPGPGPERAGRAYVFSGADGEPLHTLASTNAEDAGGFGFSVSGVPDADGDGRGDFLVGAPGEAPDASPEGAGRAYLFSGQTGALLRALASPNEETGGAFGWSVSGVQDADDDGRGDLLVGAPGEGPGDSPLRAGRAYLFSGASGTLRYELAAGMEAEDAAFGYAVSGVPDVNDDGAGDLLVGAPGQDANDGGAYLYSGATGDVRLAYSTADFSHEQQEGRLGMAVSGLADVVGDGAGDVVVGAPMGITSEGPEEAGRAYLVSGSYLGGATEGGAQQLSLLPPPQPNPFSSRTTFTFELRRPAHVRLAVCDVLGREVAVLADGERTTGRHEAVWTPAGLPAGIYLVRLEAGAEAVARTVAHVR